MKDDGSIPTTDEKPACPCGSALVFISDHGEGGCDFWQCWTCGREMVTRRPITPLKGIRWRKVPTGRAG